MHHGTAYALAIALIVPIPSTGIAQCVRATSPVETIQIAQTQYQLVLKGSPTKNMYLIPNTHVREDLIRDQYSLAELIDHKKISVIALEGLESKIPHSLQELAFEEKLIGSIRSSGALIVGTETESVRSKAIEMATVYYKGIAINAYSKKVMRMSSLDPDGFIEYSKKFSPVIEGYRRDIQSYVNRNPNIPINLHSYAKLVRDARENTALKIITQYPSIGVLWGEAHIPNFIEKLCSSDYSVYVAVQPPILIDLSSTTEHDLIPGQIEEVLAILRGIE